VRAARLVGAAEALRADVGFQGPPGDEGMRAGAIARVRALLREETLRATWREGAALPLESAVQEALAWEPSPARREWNRARIDRCRPWGLRHG
jgi:hypothetical protein